MNLNIGKLAVIFGALGTLLRIIAYHFSNSPHAAPEWVFDMDSVGYFFETLWPILLLLHISPKSILIIPASWYSYIALFDACKEVSGVNQSKTVVGNVLFWGFFILITLISCHVYKQRNS